jgi:hypothetical protein
MSGVARVHRVAWMSGVARVRRLAGIVRRAGGMWPGCAAGQQRRAERGNVVSAVCGLDNVGERRAA